MALWAIGDFHLASQVDKSMDRFGLVWHHHEDKIWKNFHAMVKLEDTTVITGDHSWGHKLHECEQDLLFIENLPGRKILLRGNHDTFWNANKTPRLNERFQGRLEFLQNNFYTYKDYALVGTKGICYEGRDSYEHFEKLLEREIKRLTLSFDKAKEAGYEKFLMFLHYPPTSLGEEESPFTRIAEENGVEQVIYSHCHGAARFDDSFHGEVRGVTYHLVSGDYLNFKPLKILD